MLVAAGHHGLSISLLIDSNQSRFATNGANLSASNIQARQLFQPLLTSIRGHTETEFEVLATSQRPVQRLLLRIPTQQGVGEWNLRQLQFGTQGLMLQQVAQISQ